MFFEFVWLHIIIIIIIITSKNDKDKIKDGTETDGGATIDKQGN